MLHGVHQPCSEGAFTITRSRVAPTGFASRLTVDATTSRETIYDDLRSSRNARIGRGNRGVAARVSCGRANEFFILRDRNCQSNACFSLLSSGLSFLFGAKMNEKRKKIMMLLHLIRMLLLLKKKNGRVQTIGVNDLFKRRIEMGDGHNLLNELRFESAMFYNYTRLNYARFDYLLSLVGPKLQKRKMKTAICPKQRLALTLRHLAVGDSQASLSFAYRVGRATVSVIVKETLKVIIEVLRKDFLAVPNTKEGWKDVAAGFERRWNLPHCVGAIDGRHMQIQCPKASGSTFFNYKKTFSVNLMAVAGSDDTFIAVDCGAEGSLPDSAVFQDAEFGKRLAAKSLNLPDAKCLPSSDKMFTYFFVGDAAFQLREDLMKPYAVRKLSLREAIYNYRISRARRVVENTFGILVNRWQIFKKHLCCSLETADLVVIATVCLHNFIIRSRKPEDQESYIGPSLVDTEQSDGSITPGTWRGQGDDGALQPSAGTRSRNSSKSATALRLVLTDYVNDEGKVEWQEKRVKAGFWGAHTSG